MRIVGPAGVFGKIPQQGDFVERQLPHKLVVAFHEWLAAEVSGGQDGIMASWLSVGPTGPGLQFVLKEPELGAWAGAVIASEDSVHRAYPLVVAVGVEEASVGPDFISRWHQGFCTAASLGRVLIAQGYEAEALQHGLLALQALPLAQGSPFVAPLSTAGALADAEEALQFWWRESAEADAPIEAVYSRGWPAVTTLDRLLVGDVR